MPNYFSVQRLYAELSSGSIVYSYRIKVFSVSVTAGIVVWEFAKLLKL